MVRSLVTALFLLVGSGVCVFAQDSRPAPRGGEETPARLIEIGRQQAASGQIDEARALSLLALSLCELKKYDEAIDAATAALAIERAVGDVAESGRTLRALARAHRMRGEACKAIEAARRSIEADNVVTERLGEVDALMLRDSPREAADEGMLAAFAAMRSLDRDTRIHEDLSGWTDGMGPSDALAKAWWFLEQSRSRILGQALTSRGATVAARLPLPVLSSHEAARRRLDSAQSAILATAKDADLGSAQRASADLEAAREDWDQSLARVHREARRVADIAYPRPVTVDELRSDLPDGTAFLAFQVTELRVIAIAVDRTEALCADLGATSTVIRRVETLIRFLSTPESQEASLAAATYDVLLKPFEPMLVRNGRLIISPDGALCFLPFEALQRTRQGAPERVVEKWEVAYVPSATVFDILRKDPAAARRGEGILAVGDPIYPEEAAKPASRPTDVALRGIVPLRRLPATGEEARAVAALAPVNRRTLLLREHATRDEFVESLRRMPGRLSAVHIACHGVVDAESPRLSGVVLGGGAVLGIDDLFGLEIPADLVVLSACETGGRAFAHGEGVLGLARAIFAGGCPRVVVSNWKISDSTTVDFMSGFHRRILNEGLAPAAALRAAKIKRLRDGGPTAHPSAWAAFVLWGLPD